MEWTQLVETVGGLVGALGTIGAALYGIGQYNRQETNKIISQLRDESSEIEQLAEKLDDYLNDALFTVIAQHLVESLDRMVPDAKSAAEYIDRLEKLDKSLITSAFIAIHYTLPFLAETERERSRLNELAARQTEYFPSLKRILATASYLVATKSGELLSTYFHRKVFSEEGFYDPKEFWLATKKMAASAENIQQARVAVAYSFAELSGAILKRDSSTTFYAAKNIIDALTKRIDRASRRELHKLLKKRRGAERQANRIIKDTKTWAEEIKQLAREIRHFLGQETYSAIIEQCAELSKTVPADTPSEG